MRKLIIELPDDLHSELKKRAAMHQKTLRSIVTDLINVYISEPRNHVLAHEETGLCGAWEDARSPEEIIKDIKSHRRWSRKDCLSDE
jgi:hypothetical protein